MKQLFRRLQQRRQRRREAASVVPKQQHIDPSIPSIPIPMEITQFDDATTVSRYTMDSRGHFVPNHDMDESILQVAVSAIEMAIRMPLKNARSQQDDGSVSYHEQHATMAVENTQWETAMFHYEHALYYLGDPKTWDTELLGTISTILNNLAYAHQICKSEQRLILHLYGAALTIKRYVYGKLHESTAKTLNNLGSTHYIFRQFHDAASYYEEARDILRLLPNAKGLSNEIATISSNLGDVHYCMKQYDRANLEYRSSLRLRWNLFDKEHPKITRLLEQIASTEQKNYDNDDASTVSSGRSNGSWQQGIQQLQMELSVDLEFLDSLETSVPIQMAKEKAVVFRELRHLAGPQVDSDSNATPKMQPQYTSWHKEVSPVHQGDADSNTTPKMMQSQYRQAFNVVSPDPKRESPSNRSDYESLKRKSGYETVVTESSLHCGGDWTVLAKPYLPTADSTLIPLDDDPKKLQCSTATAMTESTETPPATPQRQRPITSPSLTSNQRQAALLEVKSRLARLRASRQPGSEPSSLAYV